ncbi:MAG: FxsA family protein, partial [Solirubrobacteraceae bacterium]
MFALFLLILWGVAELFVAIKVADAIGLLATILLLIASWPVGFWLVRAEGRVALRRLAATVQAGRAPGREVVDGALILLGGFLLIVPGFISDVVGLLLLLAPTRALARKGVVRNFRNRFVVQATTRFARRSPSGYDVDSTASDIDQT